MLDVIECIWNKRIKVTLNFEFVKMSKYKNPIKDVGAGATFGTSEHGIFENEKIRFCGELCMTPDEMINELSGFEKAFFKKMFAGKFAKKLYRIFTYEA